MFVAFTVFGAMPLFGYLVRVRVNPNPNPNPNPNQVFGAMPLFGYLLTELLARGAPG